MSKCLLTLSIVSHGQAGLVKSLLNDLKTISDVSFEIIVTINIPEIIDFDVSGLSVHLIKNESPKGFGQNHNAAFSFASGLYFAVVNPDIRVENFRFATIFDTISNNKAGACSPEVRSLAGNKEDNVRRFPNIQRLMKRVVLRRRASDYKWSGNPISVDWVAGMFIVFPSVRFSEIGGFDNKYYMYMEDVDICRRLHKAGYAVYMDPRVYVIHDAQRASHRKLRHLVWHVQSLTRYFYSNPLSFFTGNS